MFAPTQRIVMTDESGIILSDYTRSVSTGDGVQKFKIDALAASATAEVDLTIPFALIKAYNIRSDKTVTLKTNSTSAPDETLTITAAVPLFYPDVLQVFGHNITKLFFINSAGAVANIQGWFDSDVTA